MTVSGSPTLGDIKNKEEVSDKKQGKVATAITLAVGLVYQDAANGWKNVPADGSIDARRIYFNPISIDNSGGVLGDQTGTFYGMNAIVIGTADLAIVVDDYCRASVNVVNAFQKLAVPSNSALNAIFSDTEVEADIDGQRDFSIDKLAKYLGHAGEITETDNLATDAIDTDADCLFLIVRS